MKRCALLKSLALLLWVTTPAVGQNPVASPDTKEGLVTFCSRTTTNKQAVIDCSKALANDWASFIQSGEAYRRTKIDFIAAQDQLKRIKEEMDEEQKRSMAQTHSWTASPDLWNKYDATYRYALAARGREDRALAALENAKAEVERHAQTVEVNRRAAEESKLQRKKDEQSRSERPSPAPLESKELAEEHRWKCYISEENTVWAQLGTPCLIRRWTNHNMTITANNNTWIIEYTYTNKEKNGYNEDVEVEHAIAKRRSQNAYQEYGEVSRSDLGNQRHITWINNQIFISVSVGE
jgi:hypothetical protein